MLLAGKTEHIYTASRRWNGCLRPGRSKDAHEALQYCFRCTIWIQDVEWARYQLCSTTAVVHHTCRRYWRVTPAHRYTFQTLGEFCWIWNRSTYNYPQHYLDLCFRLVNLLRRRSMAVMVVVRGYCGQAPELFRLIDKIAKLKRLLDEMRLDEYEWTQKFA